MNIIETSHALRSHEVEYYENNYRIARYYPYHNSLKIYLNNDFGGIGGDICNICDMYYEFRLCTIEMKNRYNKILANLIEFLESTNLNYATEIKMKYKEAK